MHWHAPAPFCSRQCAFEPQGLGLHGVDCSYISSCSTVHCVNGSPLKPIEHTHIGVWLITRHSAFDPHNPGHGSLHFWLMQARLLGHSVFEMHSGLQFGGDPINSFRHEQDGESPIGRHSELGPQGEGSHGFKGSLGGSASTEVTKKYTD